MWKYLVPFRARLVALGMLVLACKGSGAHSAEKTTPQAPAVAQPSAEAPLPALDETGPVMDLLSSRMLWHVHAQGLLIPFASEGFRKYSQEYTSPWRSIAKLDGKIGRVLGGTGATLHFPWNAVGAGGGDKPGEATLVVRVHGTSAGKKLTIRLNGRPLKNAILDQGWQQLRMDVPTGTLVAGENTLFLAAGKKNAVLHSVEIIPGKVELADEPWPDGSPAKPLALDGKATEALTGFRRFVMPIEIPDDGWLVLTTAATTGPARFRISIASDGKPAQDLVDETQPAGSQKPRRLALTAWAGTLVELEFAVKEGRASDAAWIAPRILLAQAVTRPKPAPLKNFIILVADALRADRLPMYATTRVRVPSIAKAAQEIGITFTSTQAASPSSPPSHASIQSGCMPRSHGILGDTSKVTPGTPMVSAIAAKAGLATDFVGDAGFAMNRLASVSKWNEFHKPNAEGHGGDCAAVVKEVLAFADKQTDKRFFISSVAFEAHTPYMYHEGITEHYFPGPFDEAIGKHPDGVVLTKIVGGKLAMTDARWGQLKGLYDGEVEHLDECFATLMQGLASRGLAGNTGLVLLSDHGEGFMEHGSLGHAYGHYAELTNVPLVWFLPGMGHGQKIATVVSHTDVVPTILDLLGLPADPRVQGESVVPIMLREGSWTPRVEPSEYGRSFSLRGRSWHYIVDYSGNESLFDTAADPTEKNDVKVKAPLALRYFRDLTGIYLPHRARWNTAAWGTLNNHRPGFLSAIGEP